MERAIDLFIEECTKYHASLDDSAKAVKRRHELLEKCAISLLRKKSYLELQIAKLCREHDFQLPDKTKVAKPVRMDKAEMRTALVRFYEKHNQLKLSEVDKVLSHFGNRVRALNEALVIQYGEGILPNNEREASRPSNSPKDTRAYETYRALRIRLSQVQQLLTTTNMEYHLPQGGLYNLRMGSDTNVLVGIGHVLLERMNGAITAEIGPLAAQPDKKQVPSKLRQGILSFRTKSPVQVAARIEQLEIVRNAQFTWSPPTATLGEHPRRALSSANTGALPSLCPSSNKTTLGIVEVTMSLEFQIAFVFQHGSWKQRPNFNLSISNLDTSMPDSILPSSIVNPILTMALNKLLPTILKKLILKELKPEFGKFITSSSVSQKECSKLSSDVNVELMGSMKLSELRKPIDANARSSTYDPKLLLGCSEAFGMVWQRGASKHGTVLKKLGFDQSSTLLGLLNIFRVSQRASFVKQTSFVESMKRVMDAYEELKFGDTSANERAVSLWFELESLTKQPMYLNIDMEKLALQVNSAQALGGYQAVLWRAARLQTKDTPEKINELLRQVHSRGIQIKRILSAIKVLAGTQEFQVSGIIAGGSDPSYELSATDVVCDGVVEGQLSSLKVGGSYSKLQKVVRKLISWWVLREDKSDAVEIDDPTPVPERYLKHASWVSKLENLIKKLLDHLISCQFLVQGKAWIGNQGDDLIFSLSQKADDPRPSLSVCIQGTLGNLLSLTTIVSSRVAEDLLQDTIQAVKEIRSERPKVGDVIKGLSRGMGGIGGNLAVLLLEDSPLDFQEKTQVTDEFLDDLMHVVSTLADLEHFQDNGELTDEEDTDTDSSSSEGLETEPGDHATGEEGSED